MKKKPGRPRKPKTSRRKSVSVTVSPANAEWLASLENKSATVDALLSAAREGKVGG